MNTPNFIVRIPEPCHEDWNKMEPDAKGKFCNSCSKSVFDFSTKTDNEIKDILLEYKDQKVCGHFKKSQVNRPLSISINLKDLPKNISMTKAFAIALFLVFGTFLFSCTDNQGQKVGEIEIVGKENNSSDIDGLVMIDVPPPPIDSISDACTLISGETMMTTGNAVVSTYVLNEDHIDGGISLEEVPSEMIVPVKEDTVISKEEHFEYYVLGQMVSHYIDKNGSTHTIQEDTVVTNARKAIIEDVISKPASFAIYPNPSSGEFTVKYLVKKRTNVLLEIFDMKGVLMRTLVDVPNQYEGNYQIPVNLNELPNGIYLVSLIKDDKKFVERVVIER